MALIAFINLLRLSMEEMTFLSVGITWGIKGQHIVVQPPQVTKTS